MDENKEKRFGGLLFGCNVALLFALSFVYTIVISINYHDWNPNKSFSWNVGWGISYGGILYGWEGPILGCAVITGIAALVLRNKTENIWKLLQRIMWFSWLVIILVKRAIHFIF